MEELTSRRYEEDHFVDTTGKVWNYSLLTAEDIRNFQFGTHYRLYEKFGSHAVTVNRTDGIYFAVWAPNASSISVIGNFNDWRNHAHELFPRWDKSGVWEGFIPGFRLGEVYKYHIVGFEGIETDKGDPLAYFWERRPQTASITWGLQYEWNDEQWMQERKKHNALNAPWSVYEVHLASWMRPDKNDEERYNTYVQMR